MSDSETKNKWDSDWASIVRPRIGNRANYPGGPAAGPGILAKYHKYYDRATKNIKEPKVLVLGATPELRDYALSQGARLTVLDQNQEIIDNMSSVMEEVNTSNEIKVVGNWLDMPFEDNSFDFIWGDGITNNILFGDHQKFYLEIIRVLKSSGYLLLRDCLIDNTEERMSIMDCIDWAHKNKMHRYDLFFKLYGYAKIGHYDEDSHIIDMAIISDKMEKEIYGKNILTEEEEENIKAFMTGTVKSTFVSKDMWLSSFREHFNLLEIGVVDDFYFCKYFNFFFSKPKK